MFIAQALRLVLALAMLGSVLSSVGAQSVVVGWDPSGSYSSDASDHGDGIKSEVMNGSTYLEDQFIDLKTNFEGKVVDGVQQRTSTEIVVKVYRQGVLIQTFDLGQRSGDDVSVDRLSWDITSGDVVEVNVSFSGGGGANHMQGTMTM